MDIYISTGCTCWWASFAKIFSNLKSACTFWTFFSTCIHSRNSEVLLRESMHLVILLNNNCMVYYLSVFESSLINVLKYDYTTTNYPLKTWNFCPNMRTFLTVRSVFYYWDGRISHLILQFKLLDLAESSCWRSLSGWQPFLLTTVTGNSWS